ncbi:MAG: 3-oxoacyl-[acyl-carrier-protein] synthase 2 [Phycisphaerales bacterium]|nr:MAG: 3-oxoacyl-[acyl-carrier-protein] synthase 2 [Phycisphaerales bacterium]
MPRLGLRAGDVDSVREGDGVRGRPVVVTGMGWVTPLGWDLQGVWKALLAGRSAAAPVSRFDASTFPTRFACEVRGFDLREHLGPQRAARHASASTGTAFALAAAWSAWRQAGLAGGGIDPHRAGLYLGAGEGGPDAEAFGRLCIESWAPQRSEVDQGRWAGGARGLEARVELEQEPQAAGAHVADLLGLAGPSMNCMTACAASTQAIGEAAAIVSRGDADVMVCGGCHSMIHPLGMTGFIRLTAMSRRNDDPGRACRPFDRTRDGFVMGEGAGVLVLESLEHALARGAQPLAEVAGYGSSADAYRITDIDPQGEGAWRAMRSALDRAGIDPQELNGADRPAVHYVSAHGTGTQENDGIETRALRRLFGQAADRVPISSIKSMLGHLIQAAGAVELIACICSLRTGWIPPTINLEHPDEACDLDYVPHAARDLTPLGGVRVALSNSFGFGGQNDSLVVRRWDG